ncbi:C-signal [Salvelinus alpinus]|uniref:C-factor isoform X1 n=1 Tax=Salvelinus namaycush TaxID=8040 RepID=A0A8U1FD83_SALNM|nr:C-factor isoform X1 [Salvelinus namaycush]XP_055790198.1 C-factor isoform X1 [Salvelinus fontinalis]
MITHYIRYEEIAHNKSKFLIITMISAFKNCRTVMVTGASRGLGLRVVESLVTGSSDPDKIIIATARNPSGAQELQKLAERHPNIHIITLDVVSQESIEKAAQDVDLLVQELGLNCLINNAGINVVANFETVTAEKMLENFHTNSVAPLMITKALLPLLKRAAAKGTGMGIHRAAVINMTSLLGSVELNWGDRAKNFKWYPYRTSKSALNMVTRCMAVDLEADGILCMGLHPGWVRTDMGGPEAPLSPEESISSVLSVIGGLTEKDHGSFLHYTGEPLPW